MRVKGTLNGEHLRVFGGAELHAHRVEFFHAHAVLAGDGAAHGDAGLQNVGAKQLAAAQLVGVVGVKQNQRVQIAIARVKHIGTAQLVFLFHLRNRQQDVGQALARNGAVHAHVVRADAATGGECVFAATPKAQALGLALAHRNRGSAMAAQHRAHAGNFFFHFLGRAVAFAQQDGGGVQVVAGMDKVFHRSGHGLVHHFQARGDDARRNHGGHRVPGFAHIVKAGHDAARQLWLGHQFHKHFDSDRQHAFATHRQAKQIVAWRIQRLAAESDGLALRGKTAHLQDVVQRQAVFEAMHAAGVFSHVAANRAGDLAAGVGRVIQAQRRRRFANGQVAHAALHPGGARQRVHFQNFVELGQRQGDATGMRHRPPRQAGARPARHHRHAQRMAAAQHRLHLRLGLGQGNHQGALTVGGQAVAFIRRGVFSLVEQRMLRQIAAKRLHHTRL